MDIDNEDIPIEIRKKYHIGFGENQMVIVSSRNDTITIYYSEIINLINDTQYNRRFLIICEGATIILYKRIKEVMVIIDKPNKNQIK